MTAQRLIIFTRYPEPHKTKTRLIPALGAEGAADVQREMTRHVVKAARDFAREHPTSVEVRFDGGDARKMVECFGNDVTYRPQGCGDLGCRMERSIADSFREGVERTVVIGADCPGITGELLRESFDRLTGSDLVMGPAKDGGYYPIGLRQPNPGLFEGIPWGSDRVLERTTCRARTLSLHVSFLKTLSDVDRPEDLEVWHRVSRAWRPSKARISVIIPTLDEAGYLPQTLRSLGNFENIEVLVVDGGSSDGTTDVAERAGCRVLRVPRGRAAQMNAGARAATGTILLFLHADTCLAPGFEEAMTGALEEPGVVAGAFRLRIDRVGSPFRIIESAVDFRSRVLQMPYGDQGIFLRKGIFEVIGGFADLPIMEDFEFVRGLRRRGRIRTVPLSATTSGRRWKELGLWRTTWINQKMILGHYLGVSPERLAAWYGHRSQTDDPNPH